MALTFEHASINSLRQQHRSRLRYAGDVLFFQHNFVSMYKHTLKEGRRRFCLSRTHGARPARRIGSRRRIHRGAAFEWITNTMSSGRHKRDILSGRPTGTQRIAYSDGPFWKNAPYSILDESKNLHLHAEIRRALPCQKKKALLRTSYRNATGRGLSHFRIDCRRSDMGVAESDRRYWKNGASIAETRVHIAPLLALDGK